jgi:probable rRNA maturation factor
VVEQEGLEALLFCFCGLATCLERRGSKTYPRQRPATTGAGDTVIIFHKPVGGLSKAALSRFVSRAQRTARLHGQVNVLVTTSRDLHRLNRQFRGKDEPTDVLSFPLRERSATLAAGDIAISADIARHNARLLGHSPGEEIKILALHGLLHLAGYNHELDNGRMAREECRLRKSLQLPMALLERSTDPPRDRPKVNRSPSRAADRKTRNLRSLR